MNHYNVDKDKKHFGLNKFRVRIPHLEKYL